MTDVQLQDERPLNYGVGLVERRQRPREISNALVNKWRKNDVSSIMAPILEFIQEYPFTSLFIGVFVGLSSLPLVVFFSFVAISFFVSFLGFMMVEGTIIGFAVIMLSFTLFVMVCVAVLLSFFLVTVWCSSAAGYELLQQVLPLLDKYIPEAKLKFTKLIDARREPKKD